MGKHGSIAGRPGRADLEHHLITNAHCTPLAVTLTSGNRNDVTQLLPLLDAIPPGPRPTRQDPAHAAVSASRLPASASALEGVP